MQSTKKNSDQHQAKPHTPHTGSEALRMPAKKTHRNPQATWAPSTVTEGPITQQILLISLALFILLLSLKLLFDSAPEPEKITPLSPPVFEALPPLRSATPTSPPLVQPQAVRPLPITPRTHWISATIQPGDTLGHLFAKLGLSSRELQSILQAGPKVDALTNLQVGQTIRFEIRGQSLLQLKLDTSPINELVLIKNGDAYEVKQLRKHFTLRHNFVQGQIQNSLFVDAQKAGLDDKLILQLADIFAWDIDFALDVQPGDTFSVLYETYEINEKPRAVGHILAAEYKTQGKVYRAVRYVSPDGEPGYYTPTGISLRKAFLRTPVKFTRISSYFTLARRHPILHRIRAHKGVDYAAPLGTQVKAAGRGTVRFSGWMNGYGNTVILQHGTRYSTLYGHMSHFANHLKTGQVVHQGQVIGFVGSTGLATAPHLHYEFRVNGIHQNPLTVTLPREMPGNKRWGDRFLHHADLVMSELKKRERQETSESESIG